MPRPKDKHHLELDGYNKSLKLAFEHNGEYHYSKAKGNTLLYDKLKREVCKQMRVTLVTIPQLFTRTKIPDLPKLISSQCDIPFVKDPDNIQIDWAEVYTPDDPLFEIKELIESKDGSLMSSHYLGAHYPLEVLCKTHQHRWEITPCNLKNGRWCPKCGNEARSRAAVRRWEKWKKMEHPWFNPR